MKKAALLVTDNEKIATSSSAVLEFIDYNVVVASNADDIEHKLLDDEGYIIALIALSDEDSLLEAVSLINRKMSSLPVYLLVTDEHSSTTFKGVTGSLKYPIQYKDLLSTVRHVELERRSSRNRKALSTTLTGISPQIKKVEAMIRHVSMTDANVLLLGESGTGKEVVARGIHHLSLRTDQPFVALNCGAIPAELLESELFGHEKGAFTGAINARRGRFELAEGGTLFLDEIGDMPMSMQVKLLRVLQERTFERVGGTKTIPCNVRLIAATHQDLEKRIGEGKFRMDLFYRLNVFPIELPPIREREGDIPLLIEQFASRMELDHRSPIEFDDSAIEALSNHPMVGNVRELENLVERLAILYPGETITYEKLPKRYQSPIRPQPETEETKGTLHVLSKPMTDVIDLKQHLTSIEKSLIYQALKSSDWVVSKAARALSLRRTTLIQKIRKLDIKNETPDANKPNDRMALPL